MKNMLSRYFFSLAMLCISVSFAKAQLVINEIHNRLAAADAGTAEVEGDINGDGVRDPNTDKFVELVNTTAANLDITGWSLATGTTTIAVHHIFPSGTVLPPGGSIVIFRSGTSAPAANNFGGAIVQVPSVSLIAITDGGPATVSVFNTSTPDASTTPIDRIAYVGTAAQAGTSVVRIPDVTGNFTLNGSNQATPNHPAIGTKKYSAGTKADGTPFVTKVKFALASESRNENSGSYGLVVDLLGVSASVATAFDLVLTSGNADDVDFQTAQTVAAGATQITIPITIEDDALLEGNEQLTFAIQHVTGGINAVPYAPSTFTLTIVDNDVTSISFAAAAASVSESSGTCQIALSIQSPSAAIATSVEVALTGGSAADIGNYTTQTVTFPANTSANRTVTVSITNDTDFEADETFTFTLQNVSQPGGSPAIGASNTFTLTITNDDASPLIINEIHGSPANIAPPATGHGDANGDGTRNATSDEFIEFVNVSGAALDVSGWVVRTGSTQLIRHTFPAGTTIPKDGALVLFGGQTPSGTFGGSIVQVCNATDVTNVSAAVTASNGLIANGGTTVNIDNALGADMITYQTPNVGTTVTASLTRIPDITGALDINAVHPLLGSSYFSPGTKTDGIPFIIVTTTKVSFTLANATVNEGAGTYQLQVSVADPNPANATSASIALTQGDAAALNNFQPTAVNFQGASPGNQPVTLTIVNDSKAAGNKVFTFEIQQVQGGSNAVAGTVNTFTLIVVDDDVVTGALLVINEIHPRLELSPNGDNNGDGVRNTTNDEFLEFLNVTSAELDIGGWKVMTGSGTGTLQHIFAEATVVPAGGAVLLFGGPDPDESAFSGSIVQTADDGAGAIGLSLTDQSTTVRLLDASGVLQDEVTYWSESASYAGVSIVRSPDGGAFTFDAQQRALPNHPTVVLSDGRQHQHSAGVKTGGAPFIEIIATVVQFVTTTGGRYENDASPSPVAVTIERPHATQATTLNIALVTPDPDGEVSFSPSSLTFMPGEPETQYINITIHDDALLEGDEVFVFQIAGVSGGDHAAPGKNKTFSFRIYDNDMPVIFNEVHAAPATDIAGDANHDGARSASEDEFVELVNVTDEVIDMSGWKLYSGTDVLRHSFLPGTKLQPQSALVVFGGGIPLGFFGGSKFQIASEGGLSLTDNGTVLTLKNKQDELRSSFTYGNDGNVKQSLTRSPDITGYYVPHAQAENASGALFSPGIKTNGWPFGNVTTGLSTEPSSSVSFYPNPARSGATISVTHGPAAFDYLILDSTGSMVKQERGAAGNVPVDLGSFAQGIYFYAVHDHRSGAVLGKGKFTVIR